MAARMERRAVIIAAAVIATGMGCLTGLECIFPCPFQQWCCNGKTNNGQE